MKAKKIYTVHSQHGYCPKCGVSLNASSTYADTECYNCGTQIEWEEFISKDELRKFLKEAKYDQYGEQEHPAQILAYMKIEFDL